MANNTVVDWFDGLECILESESRLCGLLKHGATIGQAREFVITRVLKRILPASVHIGTGKVIDNTGASSKQIDVVIYDPRFPFMSVEGGGLYFVEGVLATIEVKSTIDSDELKGALENCRSVLQLAVNGEHPEEAEARIGFYMKKENLTYEAAEQRFWFRFRPATYIFAFNGLSLETTSESVKAWWESVNCGYSEQFPLLPRVITAGDVVGFVNDGRINLNTQDGLGSVMALFRTNLRFRWFAVHIMDAVSLRLGLKNFAENFEYRLSDYYPFDSYIKAIQGAETKVIRRNP